MAFANYETKEINCKVVYFGPPGSGKTENLRSVLKNTSTEIKTGMLELREEQGHTAFFDFLPVSLGHVNDYHVKLHLYTYPANNIYETFSSVLLRGLDGYVFVADSQFEAMASNIESLDLIKRTLNEEGISVTNIPMVIQYNKRDMDKIAPVELMRDELNPFAAVDHEAIATDSVGTLDTLQSMAKLLIEKLSTN